MAGMGEEEMGLSRMGWRGRNWMFWVDRGFR